MSDYHHLQVERRDQVGVLWLNRPERHNAFHGALVEELHHAIAQLELQPGVRALVLAGRGRSFSSGADLQWMQQQGQASLAENRADALELAQTLRSLAQCPLPTIARVHGVALGGGLGLVAACDIAVAAEGTIFGTTEVRLGLTPSTIAPHVLAAIGPRAAGRYFLTGERFDAREALRIGLVHEVTAEEALDRRVGAIVEALTSGGPQALTASKRLIATLRGRRIEDETILTETAESIAQVRAGPEARAGIAAFLARRKPPWLE